MWLTKDISACKCIKTVRDKAEASYIIKDDQELPEKTDVWSISCICHNKGNESISAVQMWTIQPFQRKEGTDSLMQIKHLYEPVKFVAPSVTTKSHTYRDCDNTYTLSLSEHSQTCCTGTHVYHKGAAWCAFVFFFPSRPEKHSKHAAPSHVQKSFHTFVLTHIHKHTPV